MSNFVPEKVFLRVVLLHYFNMKKTAAESHRIWVEVYGEHALAERTCQKWFARFKSGDFGLEDEERPGQPKKLEDEELEALLDEDCCQTQGEFAESLGVTKAAISKRLKQPDTFKSKEIGFHMNSSRETLEGGFTCPKCCWNATKRSHFCIGLLPVMKNGSTTTTPSAKNHIISCIMPWHVCSLLLLLLIY